ncbi:hypothetical protein PSN45_003914 [Yamadazyma tenuis]|uniref:Uncharacterized protein n=1 Tax=Candida tenuis (strain ATCC 10573 / BCRC 21748 / CBS 615 / JCM 9827 / NBRC 10315 / NRRL Y-1498 / VKM Y-70) TaxID=590646 RepID=G3B4W9_CANTC|nr:uncharacterized protein CANTEDRAFT_114035 [Yamadazyma tenuis ATCC 10573]EGV64008.1 hypothetical protein CANTEDRAFT_114035 [Yamadazyma tenuis ATCC 10573]WEJ96375.1 hypothetical protein PSN45_003914 [Yamadazyma tenuis]
MNDSTANMSAFHTPLKRLPDRPINLELESKLQREPPCKAVPEVSPQEELKPLNEIAIQLSKTKLTNKQNDLFSRSSSKKSVYYKPPSSSNIDNQFGIKSFLPPIIKRNYPLMATPTPEQQDLDTEQTSIPTGEWENPVIQQALGRQVNRAVEIKRISTGVVVILWIQLVKKVVSVNILHYPVSVIVLAQVLVILRCVYRLFKLKDQCVDLPLNNKQRVLLGLDTLDEDVDVKVEKARYSQFGFT